MMDLYKEDASVFHFQLPQASVLADVCLHLAQMQPVTNKFYAQRLTTGDSGKILKDNRNQHFLSFNN